MWILDREKLAGFRNLNDIYDYVYNLIKEKKDSQGLMEDGKEI